MKPKDKVVIIGLDGVPCDMIQSFADTGVMPNMAKLIAEGLFKRSESTIPEISSVAWSSMITGANPGKHGIFGFTDLHKGTYDLKFPNYNSLMVKPFWEEWDCKSVVVNVPSTYPVHPMDGVHISGFVSIDINKSVYPSSIVSDLNSMDYRLDVDSRKAHESMDDFLVDLDATLDARVKSYRWLWDNQDWQCFMLVFTGTDRLLHFLYEAYEDQNHKYHQAFLDHFRKIDEVIGEIADKLCDNDLLVMLSDHGFERLDYDVYLNPYLKENGYLEFIPGSDPDITNLCSGTKAFVMDPGRIYFNYKGKYPNGSVDPSQANELADQLVELFTEFEIEGRKVIKGIYRKEDIFEGPCLDDAPDIVLVADHGFNLKAMMRTNNLYSKGIFTGKHTQDTAFAYFKGLKDVSVVPEVPKVSDLRGIMESNF